MIAMQSWVLGYVVNALWQGPVLCVAAWLLARAMRRLGPQVEHRIWGTALVAQTVVPALLVRPVSWLWGWHAGGKGLVTITMGEGVAGGVGRMPSGVFAAVAVAFAAVMLFLVARLAWSAWRTLQLGRDAEPLLLTGAAGEAWQRCCRQFRVEEAQARVSDEVSGPVTVGVRRRMVIFPRGFLEQVTAAELEAAMAHECAHMRRHDFAKNLLYEVVRLPVAWHPAAWWTRAQVAESREMVCDAMAAEAMAGRQGYARALLRLASTMVERTPQPDLHAIGVFDANRLEERVMRLTEKRFEVQGARRLALGALCVVVGIGTVATAAELRVSVAAPAVAPMKMQSGGVDGAGPRRISGGVMAGNILTKVTPVYPQEAKDGHISGSVVLHAIIGKDGTVEQLTAISGPNELRASALDAVKQWVYKPYLLNGEPTEVETTITVNYSLAQ